MIVTRLATILLFFCRLRRLSVEPMFLLVYFSVLCIDVSLVVFFEHFFGRMAY